MIDRCTKCWRAWRRAWSRPEWAVRLLGLPCNDVDRNQDGLILIQIDGLSRREIEQAMAEGKMPFVKSLLEQQRYHLHSFYSGIPSSTPAVQGELFYGVKTAVPGFGFVDHDTDQSVLMVSPATAAKVQARISKNSEGLLAGGSSYCNIYDGDAQESHFCAASIGWDQILKPPHPSKFAFVAIMHSWSLVRALGLTAIEIVLGLFDFLRRAITGRELAAEILMVASRVVMSIGLRELTIISASVDAARGLPIIHLNLLGYDEHAHRRGPSSGFARWTLKGIDRSIARLAAAAGMSDRRAYDIWIYSDHGQETTDAFGQRNSETIQAACQAAVFLIQHDAQQTVEWIPYRTATRAQWLSAGSLAATLFGAENDISPHKLGTQVTACGPLGLLYINHDLSIQQRLRVAVDLVEKHDVPMICIGHGNRTATAVTRRGQFDLPSQACEVFGEDHPFLSDVATDLVELCHHNDSGKMVLLGWTCGAEPISFAVQSGAHGGVGPNETHGFALLPCDAPISTTKDYLRPTDLRRTVLAFRRGEHLETNVGSRLKLSADCVRVMTYNVHSCLGMDGKLSPKRIARVISQSGADVITLQELDVGRTRSGKVDQAREIAKWLQMDHHFHAALHIEEERYGDAVLSRLPMRLMRTGELPFTKNKRERRGAIWVEVQSENGSLLQIINTHLSLFPNERLLQTQSLIDDWVAQAKEFGPVILCGDFNARPNSPTHHIATSSLCDAHAIAPGATSATWFSQQPLTRIDHVFTSPKLKIIGAEVVSTDLARLASDHLPLVVEIEDTATTITQQPSGSTNANRT